MDLKDAYFHIQIAPHHRRFLRFVLERVAYQFSVLPFGLSLAPHTFTKCMNAALTPLRLMGIRIVNYIHGWIIMAPSVRELCNHRSFLISHLQCLSSQSICKKSQLQLMQNIPFLGVWILYPCKPTCYRSTQASCTQHRETSRKR